MADVTSASYAVSEDGRTVCVKIIQPNPIEEDIFIDCGFEPTEVELWVGDEGQFTWNIAMPEASHMSAGGYVATNGFTIVSQQDTQPTTGNQIINAATAASGETEIGATELDEKGHCVGVFLGTDLTGTTNADALVCVCRR